MDSLQGVDITGIAMLAGVGFLTFWYFTAGSDGIIPGVLKTAVGEDGLAGVVEDVIGKDALQKIGNAPGARETASTAANAVAAVTGGVQGAVVGLFGDNKINAFESKVAANAELAHKNKEDILNLNVKTDKNAKDILSLDTSVKKNTKDLTSLQSFANSLDSRIDDIKVPLTPDMFYDTDAYNELDEATKKKLRTTVASCDAGQQLIGTGSVEDRIKDCMHLQQFMEHGNSRAYQYDDPDWEIGDKMDGSHDGEKRKQFDSIAHKIASHGVFLVDRKSGTDALAKAKENLNSDFDVDLAEAMHDYSDIMKPTDKENINKALKGIADLMNGWNT